MAMQEMSLKEIDSVSGAVWDTVDWVAAGATAAAALATGGFGWSAFLAGAAVEFVGATYNPYAGMNVMYLQEVMSDQDTRNWITSGYYD